MYLPLVNKVTPIDKGLKEKEGKTFFLCPAGNYCHPVPVGSNNKKLIEDHMEHGHETSLWAKGMIPIEIPASDLDVPFLPITQRNSKFSMLIRELKCQLRVKASYFLDFAKQYLPNFPKPENLIDYWRHPDNLNLSADQKKNLFRGVTEEERKSIMKKL
jgi:hypothetical protein